MTDGGVICDYLDVTHSPADSPAGDVGALLLSLGAEVDSQGRYVLGEGKCQIDYKRSHTRVSASGGVCGYLRSAGVWYEFLSLLGSAPHRVTRLDAAYDVDRDGADVIAELRAQHYDGVARLGRKYLQVDLWLNVRPDGRETGTWSLGWRTRARATAKVYDKAWERLQKAGLELPPRTRYEITVRRDYGASLRDAAEPCRLFWHVASPALLPKPAGVPAWESGWGGDWEYAMRELLPAEILIRRVERSGEIGALVELADQVGENGRILLARQLLKRLGVQSGGLSLAAAPLESVSSVG